VANFLDDNDDLRYYLAAGVDWAGITGAVLRVCGGAFVGA
jgi:hypothetical protein